MYLVVCVLTHITLHGGPEKWQKWGRARWVLSRFWCVNSEMFCSFLKSTFKLIPIVLGDFLFNSPCLFTVHIRPSQPMSGQ